MASWSTRYRNEYSKTRRTLARLQRAESTDETQAPHSYFSQGEQPWDWSERGPEEVMEWDDSSDANSNTWSNWNWTSWKTNWDSSWNGTPTLRIEDYDEAPPLFLNRYLPGFFPEEWTRGKREEHDTCSDRKQIPTGPVGASLKDTVSR